MFSARFTSILPVDRPASKSTGTYGLVVCIGLVLDRHKSPGRSYYETLCLYTSYHFEQPDFRRGSADKHHLRTYDRCLFECKADTQSDISTRNSPTFSSHPPACFDGTGT